MDHIFDKLQKLNGIAESDEIYQIWSKSREQFAAAFLAYADSQEKNIRNMLWGYAGATEMMLQRKVLLAFEAMEFQEHK